MGEEQRRSERKGLRVDFRGRDAQGVGLLLFEALDVSTGGTFLKSDVLLEQGEALSLEFSLPGFPRLIRAQARVAWVRRFPREEEPAGMGVEFLAIGEDDKQALGDYLSRVDG